MRRTLIFFLILACVPAFVGAAFLSAGSVFLSPDETANAFFADRFARNEPIAANEPLNIPLRGLIHPRSVLSISSRLVPVGFLGTPVVLGMFGKILTPFFSQSSAFVVPLLAMFAVLAFFSLLRRAWSDMVAFGSAILLAFHPAWMYYASRSFMPNVLFVSLLIFSAFFLMVRPFATTHPFAKKLKIRFASVLKPSALEGINLVIAGACFGLALFVRPSETVWVVALFSIGAWLVFRFFSWRRILVFFIAAFFAFSPFFFLNAELYGDMFTTGYTYGYSQATASPFPSIVSEPISLRARIERVLSPAFPFGIHPRVVARTWATNAVDLYPWLSAFVFFGLFASQLRKDGTDEDRKRWRTFFWIAAFVSAWLAAMYGSWVFYDNPDPSQVTIGNSYARYWLPMFVFWMPFAARGMWGVAGLAGDRLRKTLFFILIFFSAVMGARWALFTPGDGMLDAAATVRQSSVVRDYALAFTERDAVIVVDRADKIFFPARRVIYPLRSETTYAAIPEIARLAPLYYYGITFPPQDVEYLNKEKLTGLGLRIEKMEDFGMESLYRITRQ